MLPRSLGHRAPLLWIVLPFTAGLVAGRFFEIASPLPLLVIAGVFALAACGSAWRWPQAWAPAMVTAMLCAGAASYALHAKRLPAWEDRPTREARLTFRVDRMFSQVSPRRASGLGTLVGSEDHLRELRGQRLYFSLTLRKDEAAPIRSAVVSAIGVIVTVPRNPPADSFDNYLAGAGINFRLTRGRVLQEEQPAHAYYRFCDRAARWCNDILGVGIEKKRPALAGLLRAMMLGNTHELSDEQHDLFMQSGTMHLFAISGLNIAVIAGAIQALLLLLRLPAWIRFIIGAALLWLFVDITGAAPSAIRAFAMAVFVHAAVVFRLPANVLAGLGASAFVVVVVSPLQVFSASFLMSYTIVLALLALGLPLGDAILEGWTPWRALPEPAWLWWHRAIDTTWRWLVVTLAIGLATALVGLLTGVQFFQLLTPGALFTNVVLIPAAGLVTLAGFAALLCGLVGFTFGTVLCNHASALLLLFIEWLVRISVKVPGAFTPAHYTATWIGTAALVTLVATLVFGYATGWKRERGGWWPPFAVVAVTLIFGVKFG